MIKWLMIKLNQKQENKTQYLKPLAYTLHLLSLRLLDFCTLKLVIRYCRHTIQSHSGSLSQLEPSLAAPLRFFLPFSPFSLHQSQQHQQASHQADVDEDVSPPCFIWVERKIRDSCTNSIRLCLRIKSRAAVLTRMRMKKREFTSPDNFEWDNSYNNIWYELCHLPCGMVVCKHSRTATAFSYRHALKKLEWMRKCSARTGKTNVPMFWGGTK